MTTLVAHDVTLAQLRDRFGLSRATDPNFASEFELQPVAVEHGVSETEKAFLDRVQQNYLSQLEARSLNEESVKMVAVSPLLDAAGFYRYPFVIDSEVGVEIRETDEQGVVLTGRIDTLIVRERLWILVVESKRARFSVQTAVPQTLAYLLARPDLEQPGYGLITNGGEFLFTKLVGQSSPRYEFSETFSLLNRGNDLYRVLAILKQLSERLGSGR